MLEFVTEWLALVDVDYNDDDVHTQSNDIVRTANCNGDIPKLYKKIDSRFENLDRNYFMPLSLGETFDNARRRLLYDILSTLKDIGIPAHLHSSVTEEVYIFVIVYLLYIDIRTLNGREPSSRSQLQLPIPKKERIELWWDNYGMHKVFGFRNGSCAHRYDWVVVITGTPIGVDSDVLKKVNVGPNRQSDDSDNGYRSSKIHFVFGSGVKRQGGQSLYT